MFFFLTCYQAAILVTPHFLALKNLFRTHFLLRALLTRLCPVQCAHLLRSSCVKQDLINLLGRALSHVRGSFQTNFLHLQGIAGHNRPPLQVEQCWHLGCSALDWTGIHGPATQPCSGHRALPRSTQIGNVIQLTGPHILA